MPQDVQDLKVRQSAVDLTEFAYKLTKCFPKEEICGLTSQMRRASVSVASNCGALGEEVSLMLAALMNKSAAQGRSDG